MQILAIAILIIITYISAYTKVVIAFFIEFIGVALVNKIILVSGIRYCIFKNNDVIKTMRSFGEVLYLGHLSG